ncbi:HAMP domain-containing sensor histidine kinase [Caulobacter segnis]|uniref:sensor histidine kinase n=1 Tax=Caulobacter segnis TaxID=88688 RepID=UPI00240F9951|nr:HAMP domain-containing sensor histidine kinase [Caulobacter segnis]MDG2523344.1 HAMP domain-containing sensor histidine kinase [Caulobacter segnis]
MSEKGARAVLNENYGVETPAPVASRPTDSAAARLQRMSARRQAALDDQKRSFLRMVSHELRTPLNAIIGFSEILSSELYGPLGQPQYQEYAKLVHESGHRLLRLVNQILEIARLEGHVVDLTLAPEALAPALDQAAEPVRAELAARGARLEVIGVGPELEVRADPRGLRTIIGNLLQNAMAHCPSGAPVIVRAERDGDMIELSIEDCGDGVDPLDIPRLLRPFEQGESTLSRAAEGAGLGLPIVQLLCDAMGGTLRIVSAKGEGLKAVVRLPAV